MAEYARMAELSESGGVVDFGTSAVIGLNARPPRRRLGENMETSER